MAARFRIALAQISPRLADVEANLGLYEGAVANAAAAQARLVVFPELSLTGYHLKDEVPSVAQRLDGPVVARLRALSRQVPLVAGLVEEAPDHRFFNSAIWFAAGEIVAVHRKVYLPTYGMFDESRYFARGRSLRAFDAEPGKTGLLVCEDFWHPSTVQILALDGAGLVVCPSSSPARGVGDDGQRDENAQTWEVLLEATARSFGLFVVHVNRVGCEDGVGFWGGSSVVDPRGRVVAKAPYYEAALTIAELDLCEVRRRRLAVPVLRDEDLDLTIRELERIRSETR